MSATPPRAAGATTAASTASGPDLTGPGQVLEGLGREDPRKTLGRGDLNSPGKNFCFAVASVVFPPLAVLVKTGDGGEAAINTLLWFLGVLPGICHALLMTQTDARYAPMCCGSKAALDRAPIQQIDAALASRPLSSTPHAE